MRHPAFKSLPRLILFLGTCLLIGLGLTFCQYGLVPVSTDTLLLDGVVFGALFGVLSFLLWYIVGFADLSGDHSLQKVINYSALLALVLIAWLGVGYLLLFLIFTPDTFSVLTESLPLRAIYGLLVFITVIRIYMNNLPLEESLEYEPLEPQKQKALMPEVAEIQENSAVPKKWLEKISVKTGQKIHLVAISDILFLQAEGDYVMIHTATGRFIKEQTMKYFEENLPPNKFVRIHRSCIVNIDCISRIELYEKQNYHITLKSGHQLKVSATGYKLLKNALAL
jgi:hypothetical protein